GLLALLAPHRPRAAPRSPPLPDLRATHPDLPPGPVPGVLPVPLAHRPRAPRAAVAALMDPPEGYVALPCLVCGRVYQTLRAAPAPFCSVACADAAHRAGDPAPGASASLPRRPL